jgi:uncharacterized protein with HEPN domain
MDFTSGGEDDFRASPLIQAAVVRNLEIVGEAAKQLPQDFRDEHPTVPWREMTGMRDLLIHAYHRVDLDLVWSTVETSLPPLLDWLEERLEG